MNQTVEKVFPPGRALVVTERWLGSNAFAMMKALRRKGWNVNDLCEKEYIPLRWESKMMKAIGRALRYAATREFNRALLKAARRHTPDMFLVFKGAHVQAGTIRALQARGARALCVYPDVSFYAHGRYLPQALPAYDWIFTTKTFGLADMRAQLGITRASVIPHAADADLHRPTSLNDRDRADFACEVSFIGTWSPKKERILTDVVTRLPQLRLKVFGGQWDRVPAASPLRPFLAGYPVYSLDYVKAICGSKINLGILSEARIGSSSGDQITSRTFHIPACGGFLLHERTEELLQVFEEDRHVACFGDADELSKKISYYLDRDEDRQRISAAALAEVSGKHTWDKRIDEVMSKYTEMAEK
ncbi:MAG: glycosyltransferase [Kiritimatiellae bacterium]|nr:glycosyltransferase [Kiritimatiellia bacterium]